MPSKPSMLNSNNVIIETHTTMSNGGHSKPSNQRKSEHKIAFPGSNLNMLRYLHSSITNRTFPIKKHKFKFPEPQQGYLTAKLSRQEAAKTSWQTKQTKHFHKWQSYAVLKEKQGEVPSKRGYWPAVNNRTKHITFLIDAYETLCYTYTLSRKEGQSKNYISFKFNK